MKLEQMRILIPIDGSEEAKSILPALMPLIRARPVEILLAHIVYHVSEAAEGMKSLLEARSGLQDLGIRVRHELGWGRPAESVLRLAEENDIDLIAMTTHGRTGLRRVLMGSVAEEILRHATLPLLINRPGARVADWKRIVVALDGSDMAEEILPDVIPLARSLEATLHVVHAVHPVLVTSPVGPVPTYLEMDDPQPYLDRVCERLSAQGVFAVPVAKEGPAAKEVIDFADEIGAGLIALTTQGRTGMARVIFGSVGEEILRNAPCPVLIRRRNPYADVRRTP